MARNKKQGVDYFPLDVHIDNKLKFIKIKYGIEGYGIIICVLQHIYSQGFYCEWSEDDMFLFADEIKTDPEKLDQIIKYAIEREFFNKDKFNEYEILTSKGIQKRYKEIVRRRKDVEIKTDFLLIDGDWGYNDGNTKENDVSKPSEPKKKPTKPAPPAQPAPPKEPIVKTD